MEEEIDLRPYMVAVFRQWRLIAIITAVAAIGAAVLALSLPPVFTATSDVLILPSRSQLTFDSRFVTNNPSLSTDATSRRQTLVALASSQAIETQVLSKVSPDLAGRAYQPGALSRRLRITSDGDLLHIEATASDAQSAQALAEAWGQAYVLTVNDLYGRDNVMLHELESQLADAQKRYDEAQHDLETFIGGSTIVQVQQQISMTTSLLSTSLDGTQKLYAQYLDQARSLEATLRDAETLRQQVVAGQTDGLANTLVALALRTRAAGNIQLPIDLRFDDPSSFARSGATLADLDALIGLLRQRRDALMEQSQSLAQAISDGKDADGGLPPALQETYAQRLSALNKQFEEQSAQSKLLEQRRDLAFDSLSILQRKLEEQRVALGTSEVQVRFISTTGAPPRSSLSGAILYAGAAATAGLFLSVLIVLGLTMLQPWLALRRSQNGSERPLDRPTPG
jgi:uncharacterized protein involved in exopolysaccharide biosynthesis